MRGKHHIIVETNRLKYEFDIRRNITVVQGDSATGKTTLMGLLQEYGIRHESSGIRVSSDVNCEVYSGSSDTWQFFLSQITDSIIFIDEGYDFIFSKQFAETVEGSSNYYVLITRKPLRNLPYSINEIFGIRTTGRFHFPEKIYHEFYPIYRDYQKITTDDIDTVVLIEDAKSDYQFFSKALGVNCIGAGGNAKLYKTLRDITTDKNKIVIADGAAFGSYISDILELRETEKNISLYLPESFEWLILRSGAVSADNLEDILDNTENYIDSAKYLTWERFYTDYLKRITQDDDIKHYHKSRLSDYYISGKVMRQIVEVLPEELRSICNLSHMY